jgi:thiol-disulfide isomerase/thioredoxin
MKKLTLPLFLSLIALTSLAQQQFVIHGRIDLLSKSKNVRLSGYDPAPIQPDGSFEIKGRITQPGIALIMTDSSGASAIWLAPGEYTLNCKEITIPDYKEVFFRTPVLKGPAVAEFYNDFETERFSGFGTAGQNAQDPAVKALIKENAARYMDSVFKITNSSPVLPDMIRSLVYYIGDETTKLYIQKLIPELKKSDEITAIEDGFSRKEKIRKEKVFENFTLTSMADSNFSLASLSGKKAILLDFWASSCGPCRMNHPRLKEWYAKYAAKGLQIVSISIDDNKADWLKAIHDDGIGDWINVDDPHGFKAALMKNYYIPFIPFGFLLDQNKNIVLVNNGQDSWITEKDISAILDAK